MTVRTLVPAAASFLLLRHARGLAPRSAFAVAHRLSSISRGGGRETTASASENLKMSGTAEPFALPEARTAVPGLKEVEDQPVRNPIGSGSSVMVVGGTRGIGLEFARQCAEKGARVVATHRGDAVPEKLSELMKACEEAGYEGSVSALTMDLADEESVLSAAAELKAREGFRPLTHVIHSAGAYFKGTSFDGTARGPRDATPPVTKQIMMDTILINTVGPLLVAQAFVPLMGRTPDADGAKLPILAFLSSKVGSVHDNGSGGTYAYRASKSALNNICKSLSVDLAGECSVVLLHPGFVRTDMTGGKGLIDVDESVAGMLKAVESTDAAVGFRWVDYKAELIPW